MHPGRGEDQETNGASDGDATATKTGSAVNDGNVVEAAGRLPAPLQRRDRDRYAIVAEHGRGGLGRVFRAHDHELGRDVAIKELINRTHGAELRFFREALITARLEHPNIVAVHEAGLWADGTPFYAMKLVAGRPLSAVIEECRDDRRRRELVRRVVAVADAIAYAHERRIIHRDLKPSNIICGEFGETVVIDWGLAKDLTVTCDEPVPDLPYRMPASTELTVAGSVLGTPAYMAPEQARGEDADERADVYAIGAILREICAPAAEDLDPDLRAIMDRATAVGRSARYRSARELARDLHAYANGRRVSAREYSVPAAIAHWIRHHRTIAAMAAASLLVIAVVASFSIARVLAARQRAEHERGRAIEALEQARKDRNQALIAQASVVMDRDPTRAWKILDDNRLLDDAKLLASRIQSAGVADRTFTPTTQNFLSMQPFDGDRHIALVNSDRTLRMLDVAAGSFRIIDEKLTNPSPLVARRDNILYLKRDGERFQLTIAGASSAPRRVVELESAPWRIGLADQVVYWLDSDATLWSAPVDVSAPPRRVVGSVKRFVALEDDVLVCTTGGRLIRLGPDGEPSGTAPLDRCAGEFGGLRVAGDYMLIPTSATSIGVFDGRQLHSLSIALDSPSAAYELTPTGAVAAIDASGRGLFRAPGTDRFEPMPFSSTPIGVVGDGRTFAWCFSDGHVVVVDSVTHETWNLVAQPESIEFAFVLTEGSLLTTGKTEMRFWRLARGGLRQLDITPAVPMNAVVSPDGRSMLLDSKNGQAQLLDETDQLVPLHKHAGLAYGAAWCGQHACTASWDGSVRCSDPATHRETLRRSTPAPVRWIQSLGDDCVYIDASGNVSLLESGKILFRQPGDPRRVRGNSARTAIAVSDYSGNIAVFELDGRAPPIIVKAHSSELVDARWIGDDRIVSAGADGKVRVWSRDLTSLATIDLGTAIWFLAVSGDRIVAVTADRRVVSWRLADGQRTQFDLDDDVDVIAIAPSGRRIAVATAGGEVLVFDLETSDASAHQIDRNGLTCLSFRSEYELVACSRFGGVFSIATPHGTR